MTINIKNKKKKGFTLVEVLVVIAILGILSAIVIPKYTHYTEKARMETATKGVERVYSACLLAESTLVSEGNTSPSIDELVEEANKALFDELVLTTTVDDNKIETYSITNYVPLTSTNTSKFSFRNDLGGDAPLEWSYRN